MATKPSFAWAAGAAVIMLQMAFAPAIAAEWKVVSDQTVPGFGHPESVAYDPRGKVLYVGDFVDLKPAEKDGKGKVNKVSLDGKIIEPAFLPAAGQTLNKPKGLWIRGNRLWVADIDAVWIFDLKTKQGRKLEIPGIQFANDAVTVGSALYVSDNRADLLFRVEPADFLKLKGEPKITKVYSSQSIFPNGIYPGRNGSLIMVGFQSKDNPKGIYEMRPGKEPVGISDNIGLLDGLYVTGDGDVLATDWVTGSLFQWNKKSGMRKLAGDFKGPADFAVFPDKNGLVAVVPDLVKGDLRFVRLGR